MPNWIDLVGLANLCDLGGTTTTDGAEILPGRLWRSDNLQTLTFADIAMLRRRGLTDVVDLRSGGPLAGHQDISRLFDQQSSIDLSVELQVLVR